MSIYYKINDIVKNSMAERKKLDMNVEPDAVGETGDGKHKDDNTTKRTEVTYTSPQGGQYYISTRGNAPNMQIGDNNTMVVNQGNVQGSRNVIIPKLPVVESTEVPGNDAMNIVATHVGKDWRRLGLALGLSDGELDNVKLDHYAQGQYEVSYQMLRKWKEQAYPTELGRLAKKCIEIGRGDVSDRLTKMVKGEC